MSLGGPAAAAAGLAPAPPDVCEKACGHRACQPDRHRDQGQRTGTPTLHVNSPCDCALVLALESGCAGRGAQRHQDPIARAMATSARNRRAVELRLALKASRTLIPLALFGLAFAGALFVLKRPGPPTRRAGGGRSARSP